MMIAASRVVLPALFSTILGCAPVCGQSADPMADRSGESPQSKRAVSLNDGFSSEMVAEHVFSPDGEALAVVRFRPIKGIKGYVQPVGGIRGDIWLQESPDAPLRALTSGAREGAGYWHVRWSPDGRLLAFLKATRDNVTLWVWDRERQVFSQLSDRAIDFYSSTPFVWVDRQRLLAALLPEGETYRPLDFRQGRFTERVKAGWARQERGEVTASVLDSRFFEYETVDLRLLDVENGTARQVATTFRTDWGLGVFAGYWTANRDHLGPHWWLSPSGDAVALLNPKPVANVADGRAAFVEDSGAHGLDIELRRLTGEPVPLERPLPSHVMVSTLGWSPDGSELAFYAYGDSLTVPARLWRVRPGDGRVEAVEAHDLVLSWREENPTAVLGTRDIRIGFARFEWAMGAGSAPQLLIHAASRGEAPAQEARRDWWRVGEGQPLLLTGDLPSPADALIREPGGTVLGVAEGDIWRIDPATGETNNLTAGFDAPVENVFAVTQAPDERIFVETGPRLFEHRWANDHGAIRTARAREYLLDTKRGTATAFLRPAPDAVVGQYAPASGSLVYTRTGWDGIRLWRSETSTGRSTELLRLNAFFSEIRPPRTRWIDYVSHEGVKRRGWLMLPYGYQDDRRYPLVVTARFGSRSYRLDRELIPTNPLDDYHLFAAMGFVVFAVDVREGYQYRTTEIDGTMLRAGNDIHAALEHLIGLGIADPDRMFLTGASGTAKSALVLLAQTRRFKAAAVAAMGPPMDLAARGKFHRRYEVNSHQYLGSSYREHPGMWYSPERARAGSILTHINQVQTPILLAHGDLDVVPLYYSEEYFDELAFRGKRAQFVRYWGEGHALGGTNPANLSDWRRRVMAWFDEFGDILRDGQGRIVFAGDRAKSRGAAPPLAPEDYANFDYFRIE